MQGVEQLREGACVQEPIDPERESESERAQARKGERVAAAALDIDIRGGAAKPMGPARRPLEPRLQGAAFRRCCVSPLWLRSKAYRTLNQGRSTTVGAVVCGHLRRPPAVTYGTLCCRCRTSLWSPAVTCGHPPAVTCGL